VDYLDLLTTRAVGRLRASQPLGSKASACDGGMKAGTGTYEGELEHVLKETNPLVLYLGTIENLRAQKAADVHRVLTNARATAC
jgi:hypothetical protein